MTGLIVWIGIPLGLFLTTPVIYALEVSPLCLRDYLINYVNSCWVRIYLASMKEKVLTFQAFGQITATGVLRGVLNMDNHWAYRIPFAIQ